MGDSDENNLFATGGALGVYSSMTCTSSPDLAGRELGQYRVKELIAEGGMALVFRAERADGSFERDVAIKISTVSGLSSGLRERFLQEQAVLAGLNHPSITQLYDAGVTEEGWPYIVMELVDGMPIDEYCINQSLHTRERIRLLIEVADAVGFAHARLVVHRDIKPSNVLVDDGGRVRLLDFGIAKLIEQDSPKLTTERLLTPGYASPEQLLGEPITTASDIYQLGILAGEVISGNPLYPGETLPGAIERAAGGRSLSLKARKAHGIPRELVPVIEQCLHAAPDHRYPGAAAFKDDLTAFLNGYPVTAMGVTAGYRARKFVARNLPAFSTAAIALVAVIASIGWYTWQLSAARELAQQQAVAAEQEAERANAISEFLIDLFDAPDPQYARGADVTVRDILEQGLEKIRTGLEEQDELRATLLTTIGRVYNELGELEKVRPIHEEAIAVYRRMADPDPANFAMALYTEGQHEMQVGDFQAAIRGFDEALEVLGSDDDEEALLIRTSILNSSGIAFSRLNRFDESAARYREAIELRTRQYGRDHIETSVPIANLGRLLAKIGSFEEALPLLESSYETAVEELGPYHPWIAPRAINLGRTYKHFGRIDEAESLLRVALDQDRYLLGEEHHYVASSLQNLGVLIYDERSREEGIELVEQGLVIEETALGDSHIDTNQTRGLLGHYYTETGRFDEAEVLLDAAARHLDGAFESDHVYTADVAKYRGQLYLATDRPRLAQAELDRARGIYERLFGLESERLEPVDQALARVNDALDD